MSVFRNKSRAVAVILIVALAVSLTGAGYFYAQNQAKYHQGIMNGVFLALMFGEGGGDTHAYTFVVDDDGVKGVDCDFNTIEEAVENLPATGGSIYVRSGTYVLNQRLNVSSNTLIRGEGYSTLITTGNTVTETLIYISGNSNITISNLHIDCKGVTGVLMRFSTQCRIENCYIISSTSSEKYAVNAQYSEYVYVIQNLITGSSGIRVEICHAVSILGNTLQEKNSSISVCESDIISIQENTIKNTENETAINLWSCSDGVLSGNILRYVWRTSPHISHGIYLSDSERFSILENQIYQVWDYGIYVNWTSDITISGNTVTSTQDGIHAEVCDGVVISGNKIERVRDNGVYEYFCKWSVVCGNGIETANCGIYIEHSHTSSVSGNSIYNTDEYGIYVDWSCDSSISSNTIVDSKHGLFVYNSPSSTITGNSLTGITQTGMKIFNSYSSSISSNILENIGSCGIYLYFHSSLLTVSENNIRNVGSDGIYMYYYVDNCTISSNVVYNATNGITLENIFFNHIDGNLVRNTSVGINENGTSNWNYFIGNNLYGNTKAINKVGANTTETNNVP